MLQLRKEFDEFVFEIWRVKNSKKTLKFRQSGGKKNPPKRKTPVDLLSRWGLGWGGRGEVPLTTKDELDFFHSVSVVLVQKMHWALTKNSEEECNFGCCYLPNSNIIRPDVLKHQPPWTSNIIVLEETKFLSQNKNFSLDESRRDEKSERTFNKHFAPKKFLRNAV